MDKTIIQDPQVLHTKEYNHNYLRNNIIALIQYNKPVIVTGYLQINPNTLYYSFMNIKPFYPKYEKQLKILCDHVNISKRQIDAVLNINPNKNYSKTPFVLICKPYTYRIQTDSEERGGLNLTAELGIPGIMSYEDALKIIPTIDSNKYIDFLEFGGGCYLSIDPIQQKRAKRILKQQRRLANNNHPVQVVNTSQTEKINKNFVYIKNIPLFPIKENNSSNINISYLINNAKVKNPNMLDGWFLKI